MADIKRFKPLTTQDVFKGFDKSFGSVQTITGSSIRWDFVSRSGETYSTTADDMKNLFHSFGIAREDQDDWFKVFNVVDWFNAKSMVIASIPQSGVSSYIDGSTVKINVPIASGSAQYTTFYGSTYESYPDPITALQIAQDHADSSYGGAYCYLFANSTGTGALPTGTFVAGEIHPYTGTVNGGPNPNALRSSFDVDPSVVTPHLSATHWEMGDTGNDKPYGVALLDRGIFVIFDYYNRNDFISKTALSGVAVWNSASAAFGAVTYTAGTAQANIGTTNRKHVSFTGANAVTNASITYRTIDQSYKMIYFCHCGQAEFNSTSNHTYNHKKAYYRPEESDSLWVTEVGLYDDNDDLLAYAKLSQPVEKNKLETLTFKVELEL